MKILCIGGGPAGLYFSILMKRADPSHDITLLERNPPEQTFGWGVVFSDETLGTKKRFDAFTFAFEETPHGWFQAHAYQFDGETSTFIVETPDEVWHKAGLDKICLLYTSDAADEL